MYQSFFYDEQIRRFLLQFTRLVSNFQIEYGRDEDNANQAALLRVPVRYGDASRNAQTIIQQNSANMMPATPLMTFYISNLEYARDRLQEPYFVSKMNVRQRTYDSATETYETTQGNAFTVERLMPAPYTLTINLDIWTSNTNQKLQLLEQMLPLFNPSLEIQSTDNFIDWTSLSVVYLDRVTWTSRSIPQGTENPIDIATLTFSMPIWLSLPVKVKKLGVVERVIMNMYDAQGDINEAVQNSDLLLGTRIMVTPWNYKLVVIDNQIQVLYDPTIVPNGDLASLDPTAIVGDSPLLWPAVLGAYGAYRPGISQIRLNWPIDNPDNQIIGTITINPNDDRLVIYDVDPDTAPQNTLEPIDAIIDPLASAPGYGLPEPVTGVRYLLTQGTGSGNNLFNPTAWLGDQGQALVAQANDIIEWNGFRWRIMFVSQDETATQYVTNITTGVQYEWTGTAWQKSYQGVYPGGTWTLVL
jgi:hypothetical protein|nr:hypothetical protein [Oxalobacteraceae bacterium]